MRIIYFFIFFFALGAKAQPNDYVSGVKEGYEVALIYYEKGSLDSASWQFESVLKLDSTCYEARYMLSLMAIDRSDYLKSLELIEQVKNYRPFYPQTLALEGRVNYFLSRYARAEAVLKQATSLGQMDHQNNYYLALSLIKNGKNGAAINYLDVLIAKDSMDSKYWAARGDAYFQLEDYEQAVADYKRSLFVDNQNFDTRIRLIQLLNQMDSGEEAKDYIDAGLIIADETSRLQLLLLQGNYYRHTGAFEQAQSIYGEALELDSLNPLVLTYQSSLLIDLENFDEAIRKCNEALAIDSTITEAYFNRGIAHEMLREIEEACSDWEQAFILGSQKAIEYLNGPVCNE